MTHNIRYFAGISFADSLVDLYRNDFKDVFFTLLVLSISLTNYPRVCNGTVQYTGMFPHPLIFCLLPCLSLMGMLSELLSLLYLII
jgi:hypothetical protein